MSLSRILLTLGLGVAVAATAAGADPQPPPEAEERVTAERQQIRDDFSGIRIDERLGESIDLSIPFVDHHGNAVQLSDYLQAERPVIVTFVYHDCPMLCSLVLDGVTAAVEESSLTLGADYSVLAVSIDPNDTYEEAAAAHARYAQRLSQPNDSDAYLFLTGTETSIERITEAVGFRFEWIERQQEFAHSATLVFLSPAGTITRYLHGLQFPSIDFRRAVVEAGEGTVGSALDQLLLYCFAYDPDRGGYVLHATNAMKVGGLLTLVLLLGSLLLLWRREVLASLRRRAGGAWLDYEDGLRTAQGP